MATMKMPFISSTYISEYDADCNFSNLTYMEIGNFHLCNSYLKSYLSIAILEISFLTILDIKNLNSAKLILNMDQNNSNLKNISFQIVAKRNRLDLIAKIVIYRFRILV